MSEKKNMCGWSHEDFVCVCVCGGGGHHKTGLFRGVISMHFVSFLMVTRYIMGIFLGGY